jgi:hypothetical protein
MVRGEGIKQRRWHFDLQFQSIALVLSTINYYSHLQLHPAGLHLRDLDRLDRRLCPWELCRLFPVRDLDPYLAVASFFGRFGHSVLTCIPCWMALLSLGSTLCECGRRWFSSVGLMRLVLDGWWRLSLVGWWVRGTKVTRKKASGEKILYLDLPLKIYLQPKQIVISSIKV